MIAYVKCGREVKVYTMERESLVFGASPEVRNLDELGQRGTTLKEPMLMGVVLICTPQEFTNVVSNDSLHD